MTVTRPITAREIRTMEWFQQTVAQGNSVGKYKIVTMQRLAARGFAKPVYARGMIIDWKITPAGVAWSCKGNTND